MVMYLWYNILLNEVQTLMLQGKGRFYSYYLIDFLYANIIVNNFLLYCRLSHKYNSTEKNKTTDLTVGTTGSTALHFAAANGCTQSVELLLKNGAIVDVSDKYGSTPLSVALAKNHADVAELLRAYGAIQAAEKQK